MLHIWHLIKSYYRFNYTRKVYIFWNILLIILAIDINIKGLIWRKRRVCLVPHANPAEIRDVFRGSSQFDGTNTADTGREKGFDRPRQDPPFSTPGNSQS